VVLGLLWFVLGIASLKGASSETAFLGRLAAGLVLLVVASLTIHSWRARHKSDYKPY
jgi:hypothetical protein